MDTMGCVWSRRQLLGTMATAAALPAWANPPGEVLVVSTLYARHRTVPAYGLPVLQRLIDAVKPQVLVLDVTPAELRNRKVWPGKVEYTEVIFPYLDATRAPAFGSEPDEALFTRLTGAAGQAYKSFGERNPAGAKALDELKQAAYRAMATEWTAPADVNSGKTDLLVAAMREIEEALVGGEAAAVQRQWDQHHADRLRDVVRAHPGKRVLMLVGIESRYRVLRNLQSAGEVRLVDTEAWLRRAGL